MATSQKEQDFIREPLKDAKGVYKCVSTIGGISDKPADALGKRGYSKAFHLIGQYLILNMDEELFKEWLRNLLEEEHIKVQDRFIDSAFRCVSEWCRGNM